MTLYFSIIKKGNKITAHPLSQQLNVSLSSVKSEIKNLETAEKQNELEVIKPDIGELLNKKRLL